MVTELKQYNSKVKEYSDKIKEYNKKIKENIAIICLLYIVGVISGIVLEFLKFTV